MRASRQEQVGGAGLSEVAAAFERVGWGAIENSRHDLGTDLFALARDQRLFDPGLILGVQVKAGASYFREPKRSAEGAVVGWWFRDRDRRHIDYWLAHSVPHLIVLHDLETRTSYWQHIAAEWVVEAGKGAKVLVPVANTIDEDHREALIAVAGSTRSGQNWEGSAWTGVVALAPRDLLRHALIVPRLVAPHPNAGFDANILPEQAIALLVQARVQELQHAANTQRMLSISAATAASDWSWRFFGAFGQWAVHDEIEPLLQVVADAPSSETRAASAVAAASALLERSRADDAIVLLEEALLPDDGLPVDHAWLTLQHARACVEIGRIDEARSVAVAVQTIRSTAPNDVTATAIAGVAAVLLFNTSALGERDVADAITGADTAAAWWRAQTLASGLGAVASRTFGDWARDTSTYIGPDDANNQLVAASLTASHVGDQGGWRYTAGLLGQDQLLRLDRHADPEQAARGITVLRLAGNEKAVKLSVQRLARDGPAAAVTLAAAAVQLDRATRTTAVADLALLGDGGDLLDDETANRTLAWLLDALDDSSSFVSRTSPHYLVPIRLLETLAGVIPAIHVADQAVVVERLLALSELEYELLDISWARVVHALADEAWTDSAAHLAMQRAAGHRAVLRMALLTAAAMRDPTAKEELTNEARSGSLSALRALGDVRDLPDDVATRLIETLADLVDRQVADAQRGVFGIGSDIGQPLALLNVWHPGAAKWGPLLGLLDSAAAPAAYKRSALDTLASLADRLHDEPKDQLRAIAVDLSQRPTTVHLFGDDEQTGGLPESTNLAVALDGFDAPRVDEVLLDLLDGSPADRQIAARIAWRRALPEDIGVLATLSLDSHPSVRGAAAANLANLVATERADPLAVEAFRRCLDDPGREVPANIAASLVGAPARGAIATEALTRLRSHRSAYVRARAGSATRSSQAT